MFDLVIPYEYSGDIDALLNGIDQAVKEISPSCRAIVDVDRSDA